MLSSSLAQQLQAELKGATVLTPGSEGYEESLKRWSETAEKRAGAVAQVTTPEQVAIVISFAREHNIEQVVRGGGHGTNGASSTEGGIVIDLSKMNRVTVDPDNMTITAEGGCLWKHVDEAAGDYGLAAVGGTVNHTGIGGLTLGGGYGYLTGRHGLVIDNLLKVKLVNADSDIVTASPEENPDLFWALRGAGASFGAVVEFTYRAHQQREPVWAGMAVFPLDKLAPIVKFANDFAHSANPDASFNFGFTTPPHAPGPMLVTLGFYNGLGKDGKRIFAPLFEAGPAFQNFGPMPYCKVNALLEESAGHGGRKVIGGAACAIPFAPEFYEEIKQDLLSFIEEVPAAKESLLVFELVHHGKVQEVDGSATAFANRGPYYNAVCMTKWNDPNDDGKCRDFTFRLKEKVSEHLIKTSDVNPESIGKYLNYNDLTDGRSDEMFGSHDEKLVALKLKYDPTNVFNKWGAVTAAAVEQNHGYNTMNLKPRQIAVE
ncbi:MAG: hypothetical protein L6R42_001603 [Xanthoria sp. 1 TBL-2021]|nr:MAG: hypothetical protein L6R42_001603 [Xanthoria sp. 1 TBL-2021]